MEEADARLQEVVASLLNEHGGNHEPALRQTFACLHNSGLYEAQSPQEEEQREQQVRPPMHAIAADNKVTYVKLSRRAFLACTSIWPL